MERKKIIISALVVLAVVLAVNNIGSLTGAAVSFPGWSHCASTPCFAGDGDCDSNLECVGDLVCKDNVGEKYGWSKFVDVCEGEEVEEVEEPKCIDSDGGKSYSVKGIAQGYPDIVQGSTYDCCKNSMEGGACINSAPYLSEAICDGTTPSNIMYNCPNGCEDGACVEEIPLTPSKEVTYQGVLEMLQNCEIDGPGQGETCLESARSDGAVALNTYLVIFYYYPNTPSKKEVFVATWLESDERIDNRYVENWLVEVAGSTAILDDYEIGCYECHPESYVGGGLAKDVAGKKTFFNG